MEEYKFSEQELESSTPIKSISACHNNVESKKNVAESCSTEYQSLDVNQSVKLDLGSESIVEKASCSNSFSKFKESEKHLNSDDSQLPLEVTSSSKNEIKRKRGRPKKNVQSQEKYLTDSCFIDTNQLESESSLIDNESSNSFNKLEKNKKSLNSLEPKLILEVQNSSTNEIKKKRGRPKKNLKPQFSEQAPVPTTPMESASARTCYDNEENKRDIIRKDSCCIENQNLNANQSINSELGSELSLIENESSNRVIRLEKGKKSINSSQPKLSLEVANSSINEIKKKRGRLKKKVEQQSLSEQEPVSTTPLRIASARPCFGNEDIDKKIIEKDSCSIENKNLHANQYIHSEQGNELSLMEDESSPSNFDRFENSNQSIDSSKLEFIEGIACSSTNGIKRKKGRPRKGQEKHSTSEAEPIEVPEMSYSKRGRKRKDINYSYLLNSGFENDTTHGNNCKPEKNTEPMCSPESQETQEIANTSFTNANESKRKRGRPRKSQVTHPTEVTPVQEEEEVKITYSQRGRKRKEIDYSFEVTHDAEEKPYKKRRRLKLAKDDDNDNDFRVTYDSDSSSAISNCEDILDVEASAASESQIIVDVDGMVCCMVCKNKILEAEWETHKRDMHYNLAWANGEPKMDFRNRGKLRKILDIYITNHGTQKKLPCYMCGSKFLRTKHYVHHLKSCYKNTSTTDFVTCAVCNQGVTRISWYQHKLQKHNNLAWRVGDEPLDLNDKKFVFKVLLNLYKTKKPLHCQKCGQLKKSVVGLLSHEMTCQKSENELEEVKFTCELCGRKMLPVSKDCHMKYYHAEKSNFDDEDLPKPEEIDLEGKRTAAKKALKIIDKLATAGRQESAEEYIMYTSVLNEKFLNKCLQELSKEGQVKCRFENCSFESEQVQVVIDHMNSCEKKPPEKSRFYLCIRCSAVGSSKNLILDHVVRTHEVQIPEHKDKEDIDYEEEFEKEDEDNVDIELDNEDDDGFKYLKKQRTLQKQKMMIDENVRVKPTFLLSTRKIKNTLFCHAFEWTFAFTEDHYSKLRLFDNLNTTDSNYVLLENMLLDQYLPKTHESCNIGYKFYSNDDKKQKKIEPKRIQLFEFDETEGYVTIFCGGPVIATAWLPTPTDINKLEYSQILAVSTARDMEAKYALNSSYSEPSVIQFWDFGPLRNKNHERCTPILLFGLAVDFGPVWYLEWCPSGCYDDSNDELSRLGLLAMAGSDSLVYIYAVPKFDNNSRELIYKANPVLILQLHSGCNNSENNLYATKVSWSKANGHNYVAVGYSDGTVGLFNLSQESKTAKNKNILYSFKLFQAHCSAVTALSLSHLDGGCSYLMTGGFDRDVVLWDLNSTSQLYRVRRNYAADGVWMSHWLNCIWCFDGSPTSKYGTNVFSKTARDFLSNTVVLTPYNSPNSIIGISSSDWLNAFAEGSSSGQLSLTIPGQMLFGFHNDKSIRGAHFCLGYTKLEDTCKDDSINKKEQKEELLDSYASTDSRKSLIFVDHTQRAIRSFPKMDILSSSQKLERTDPVIYPLRKINRISFNPNMQASTFYVTGYQAGFIRLGCLRFLENDVQVM